MEQLAVYVLLFAIVAIYVYKIIDPKTDWNYETGDKLLWFNDPFDSCRRKAVTISKGKS